MIGTLFQRFALLSLSGSMVLLPLLLFAGLIQRRYRAQSCAVLWLLLAVRLLLPVQVPLELLRPAVTLPMPEYTAIMLPQTPSESAPAAPASATPSVGAKPPAAEKAPTRSAAERLGTVWLLGAAVFLLGQGAACRLTRRRLMRGAREDAEDRACVERLRRELGVKGNTAVWRTAWAATPLTLGLLRPVILLPEEALPAEHLELVLRHELLHIRRGDLWYKALLLAVNAVHWFNPLVWWMAREAGRNLEYCCDDAVVRGRDADFRRRYGEVLLHAAGGGGPVLCTRFGDSGTRLKGRLMNLFQTKRTGAAMVCVVLAGAVLAGGLVACESAGAAGSGDPAASAAPPAPTETARAGKDLVLENVVLLHLENSEIYVPVNSMEPDVMSADTMGEVLVDRKLTDGTEVVCYWMPDSEYTKYWAIRQGDSLLRFCVEDSAYQAGYSIEEFQNVLGKNGFRIEAPRGAAYQAYDYYYIDTNGVPRLLADCANWVEERDSNGDGEKELLYFYDGGALPYYYFRQGEVIYKADIESLWRNRFPDFQLGAKAPPFEWADRGLTVYYSKKMENSSVEPELQKAYLDFTAETIEAWLEKDASEVGCQWPVPENYQISALSGSRVHPVTGEKRGHSGVDIAAPEGTSVLAALGGVVVASGFDAVYGNYVELTHENGLSTLYAQLSAREVEAGETVDQGQVIGTVGSTGTATGPHLHFEVTQDGTLVDPLDCYPPLSEEAGAPAELSIQGTTFTYGGRTYDLTERSPAISSITAMEQVGGQILLECHTGPKNNIYVIFDPQAGTFVEELTGTHLIWKGENLTTSVYAFWGDICTYDGIVLATFNLGESGYVSGLSFTEDGKQVEVEIIENGESSTQLVSLP